MKKYRVTFKDTIVAETEEAAYDKLLEYLGDCVRYQDVVAFDFEEVKEPQGSYHM